MSQPVAAHGGIVSRELAAAGFAAGAVVDFSVNVNPYGPCREVLSAVREAAVDRYPDPSAAPAREALGDWIGVDAENVVAGNGAVEILWAAARALVRSGDRVLVVEPAFSELRRAAALAGAAVVEFRARPEDDFAVHLGALRRAVVETRPRLVHLATPGNPTGHALSLAEIGSLVASLPDVLFVLDVSFVTLSDRAAEFPGAIRPLLPNAVWVWSLTKEQSIPGVRLGCAVASPVHARVLRAQIPPWSTGAAAQAAAVVAVHPSVRDFVERSRRTLARDRRELASRLCALGLHAHSSEAPYVLVRLAPPAAATALRRALFERHGVLVRDASSFGLPHHVRLAARSAADVDRLIRALRSELG